MVVHLVHLEVVRRTEVCMVAHLVHLVVRRTGVYKEVMMAEVLVCTDLGLE